MEKASTTHKERVEKFNEHLDTLTEHFDIPKVSWTKQLYYCIIVLEFEEYKYPLNMYAKKAFHVWKKLTILMGVMKLINKNRKIISKI